MNNLTASQRQRLARPFYDRLVAAVEDESGNWVWTNEGEWDNCKGHISTILKHTPEEFNRNVRASNDPFYAVQNLFEYMSGFSWSEYRSDWNKWFDTIQTILADMISNPEGNVKAKGKKTKSQGGKLTTRIKERVLDVNHESNVRALADQTLKTIRAPLAQIIVNMFPEESRPMFGMGVEHFLNTPQGEAASKMLVSMLLPHIPLGDGLEELKDEVCRELQITAATGVKVHIADKIVGPLREHFAMAAGNVVGQLPGKIAGTTKRLSRAVKTEQAPQIGNQREDIGVTAK